jgi:hypothetical protein
VPQLIIKNKLKLFVAHSTNTAIRILPFRYTSSCLNLPCLCLAAVPISSQHSAENEKELDADITVLSVGQ